MLTYCLKCKKKKKKKKKKNAESVDSKVLNTKNGRPMLLLKCVVWGSKNQDL